MTKKVLFYAAVLVVCGLLVYRAPAENDDPSVEAIKVLDAFMEAFNAKDAEAWASTFHFPHVRLASGTVTVYPTKQDRVEQMDFDAFAKRFNWDHSAWDYRKVIQAGENKVHIDVQFTRYDAEDNPTATFKSLYIVTKDESGKWGIQARSSFAP